MPGSCSSPCRLGWSGLLLLLVSSLGVNVASARAQKIVSTEPQALEAKMIPSDTSCSGPDCPPLPAVPVTSIPDADADKSHTSKVVKKDRLPDEPPATTTVKSSDANSAAAEEEESTTRRHSISAKKGVEDEDEVAPEEPRDEDAPVVAKKGVDDVADNSAQESDKTAQEGDNTTTEAANSAQEADNTTTEADNSAQEADKTAPNADKTAPNADKTAKKEEGAATAPVPSATAAPKETTPAAEKKSGVVAKKGVEDDDEGSAELDADAVASVPKKGVTSTTAAPAGSQSDSAKSSGSTNSVPSSSPTPTIVMVGEPKVKLGRPAVPANQDTPDDPTANQVDPTPDTSLIIGVVFACILLSVIGFLAYKRFDALRRRRDYRRMNDFLIDGMYNDL